MLITLFFLLHYCSVVERVRQPSTLTQQLTSPRILSAASGNRLFSITNTGNLTLGEGITLTGGSAERVGAVYVNGGTFTMNDSATVSISNDLYLLDCNCIKSRIIVTGELDQDAGALNITPGYTSGTVVHYNDGVSLGTLTNTFALNTTWAKDNTLGLNLSGNDILLGTKYTVTFYNNTIEIENQIKFLDDTLTPPTDPKWTGYTFNGWNTTNVMGTPWNFGNDRVAGDTTLYANWIIDPTPTPTPTIIGGCGNTDDTCCNGPCCNGTYTSTDGGVEMIVNSSTTIIVTVFKDYLGGADTPPNVEYLEEYDLLSTAPDGT